MNPLPSAVMGAVVMALMVLACWYLRPWRLFSMRSLRLQRDREIREALAVVTQSAATTKDAEQAAVWINDELSRERRRSSEYFSKIEEVLKERDEWRKLYYEQAIQHGAAQDMLLSERDVNARTLISLGKQPFVHPSIARVVAAFRDEHVDPVTAAMAAAMVEKIGPTNGTQAEANQ